MKSKIGFVIHKDKVLKSEIKSLKSMGYDFIELGLTCPFGFEGKFKNKISEINKILPISARHLPMAGFNEGGVRVYKKFIDSFSKIGCKTFVIHLELWKADAKKYLPFWIKILRDLDQFATNHGSSLVVENCMGDDIKLFKKVFDEIKEIGFCLDIGHANLYTKKNISLDLIKRFGKRLKHIHAQDNRGGYDVSWDLHLPIGAGRIDFKPIFKELRKIKYSGTITLEVHNFDNDYRKISLKKIKELISA